LTSNYTLKDWIPKKSTITELLTCDEKHKIENNITRVAYQTAESGIVGRSFEEAFINTNLSLLKSTYENDKGEEKNVKNLFSFSRGKSAETLNDETPFQLAPISSSAKTNFAFDVMSFPEDDIAEWQVPAYIDEGLKWLEKSLEENIEKETIATTEEEE
jgi:hypothetical protein